MARIKEKSKEILSLLPDALKIGSGWIKTYFDEHGKEIMENASGTVGLAIKIFGAPLLARYFQTVAKEKLSNYGINCYVSSAYKQAAKSIQFTEGDLPHIDAGQVQRAFENLQEQFVSINLKEVILVFTPKYHPAVVHIRNSYILLLQTLEVNVSVINKFRKHFNENIDSTVETEFGADYQQHLKTISHFLLEKNEADLLWDTIQQGRIGFDENEDLSYEETYGEWRAIQGWKNDESRHTEDHQSLSQEEAEKLERNLRPVHDLMEEYFGVSNENHLEKILFIVADFGKGKSVFLRHHAATLAKQYLENVEGYFPVYFNLRNFNSYSSDTALGVLSDYLLTKYAIDLSTDHFKRKRIFFLIDSLDESGELSKQAIDRVINSIKRVQNLDKTKNRINKIAITSRPFDEGLESQLRGHCPFIVKSESGKDISQYLALYGFKKEQFNSWLNSNLRSFLKRFPGKLIGTGLSGKVKEAFSRGSVLTSTKSSQRITLCLTAS